MPKKADTAKPKGPSPFSCAMDMGKELVYWKDRSPEFRKAYSQFMINRLLTLDSRWLRLLAQAVSLRKFTNQSHHDYLVAVIAGKGWNLSGYKEAYPKNDDVLIKATCMYYEIGTKDATLIISGFDDKEKKKLLAMTGLKEK